MRIRHSIRENSCLKAQSFITYAFLLAVVVAALVAMTTVIRYSIQGRYRQAADVFGQGEQFEPQPGINLVSAYAMYEGHYNVYYDASCKCYFKVSYYRVTVNGKDMWLEVYESLNSSDPNDVNEVTGWVLLTNDENGVHSYASWWAGQQNVSVGAITWTDKQYIEVGYSHTSEYIVEYYKYNQQNFDPHNFNWQSIIGQYAGQTTQKTVTTRLPNNAEGNYVFAATSYTYVGGTGWVQGMTEVAYFNYKYGWVGSDHYDSQGRLFRSFRRISGDKE